jgi:3-oxoacyl-[acyl-carrier-protein] synthase-3
LGVGILGVGKYLPEYVRTNFELETMLNTSDEWIRSRTGICERRIADDDQDTSSLAINAAHQALNDAGVCSGDIDLILVATCTPDGSIPSMACRVQQGIGAVNAAAFDLNAACSGFVYALVVAKQFIDSGTYRRVMVIGADKFSKIIDWRDRNTAILFGDGAGAVILGSTDTVGGLLAFELGANGGGGSYLYQDDYLRMNGREVFRFSTRIFAQSVHRVAAKAGWNVRDVDFFVPHQANVRIIDYVADELGVSNDRFSKTVTKYGNTSAASIPISLYDDVHENRICPGHNVMLCGFGGGLTWATVALTWT